MANKSSKSREAYAANYNSSKRWKKNRELKLLRELKRNPNNAKQIEDALASIEYRRKTPKTQVWSKSMIAKAKLLKLFSGSAPLACFNSNEKVAAEALAGLHKMHDPKSLPVGKVDFSLGARAFKN